MLRAQQEWKRPGKVRGIIGKLRFSEGILGSGASAQEVRELITLGMRGDGDLPCPRAPTYLVEKIVRISAK